VLSSRTIFQPEGVCSTTRKEVAVSVAATGGGALKVEMAGDGGEIGV
jgi:hypothetical protein